MAEEKRLIDANALLELVQFRLPIDNQNAEVIAGCVNITRRLIENAPTEDAVEVVHGRWMNVQNGKGICSNCNRLDSIDNLAIYCRYCGAKMDGERRTDNERKAD